MRQNKISLIENIAFEMNPKYTFQNKFTGNYMQKLRRYIFLVLES